MSSFLTKSSTETDNQRAVTRAEVLMCELIAKYIIYISISLYVNFHHEILDYWQRAQITDKNY
jgi:hypothetical protein